MYIAQYREWNTISISTGSHSTHSTSQCKVRLLSRNNNKQVSYHGIILESDVDTSKCVQAPGSMSWLRETNDLTDVINKNASRKKSYLRNVNRNKYNVRKSNVKRPKSWVITTTVYSLNFIKSQLCSKSVRAPSLFNFLNTRFNFSSDKSQEDYSFQFKLSHSRQVKKEKQNKKKNLQKHFAHQQSSTVLVVIPIKQLEISHPCEIPN